MDNAALVAEEYRPGVHDVHPAELELGWYWPGEQLMQARAPTAANIPAGQGEQEVPLQEEGYEAITGLHPEHASAPDPALKEPARQLLVITSVA